MHDGDTPTPFWSLDFQTLAIAYCIASISQRVDVMQLVQKHVTIMTGIIYPLTKSRPFQGQAQA
jgi:hypothetical protein